MKIALICTEKLPVPPISGGAIQIYIQGILPELSKHHDMTVFSIRHESLPDEEEVDGVKYIRVEGRNKAEYVRNIEQKLDGSYDLVHVFNRPRWVVRLAKNLPAVKFSLSLHNEMVHEEKIPREMALECIHRVSFIATVSDFIADGVLKLFPEAHGKIHTVYSGVDIDKFKPALSEEGMQNKERLKRELGLEDKKVVLFVGRLGEKKGVDKLIAAMKSVMDVRSDVALVIVGSKWYGKNTADDYSKALKALSQSLSGPVIFTGYLPHEVIPAYYNLGDIFVCSSQWNEPLARVHYEAMAAGLPIITTNRGGNREVVEGYGNGIVIDDFSNPDAFSEKILYLLDNPETASAMGLKGRKLAEEKYSWNRVANDLLALFKIAEESEQVLYEAPSDSAVEEGEASEQDLSEQHSETDGTSNEAPEQVLPEQHPEKDEAPEQVQPEQYTVKEETPKQVLPRQPVKVESTVFKQVLPKRPAEHSKDETKASDKMTTETDAETNDGKAAAGENHVVFRKMIKSRYPSMPEDVVEFLEEFKDYFLRGELY